MKFRVMNKINKIHNLIEKTETLSVVYNMDNLIGMKRKSIQHRNQLTYINGSLSSTRMKETIF